jgi:hypothetical protein
MSPRPFVIGSLLTVLFAAATPTTAETVNCTAINSIPAIITVPGIYCLTRDLTTAIATGSAIDIQTNNVVIDLNGHRLGGGAAGLGTGAFGIHANNPRLNITVKNGTVRGFLGGIVLEGGTGHLIEDILADGNTAYGIILVGARSVIRRNRVISTGGTTFQTGPGTGTAGIAVFDGADVRVVDNDIAFVTRGATAVAVGIGFDGGANNLAIDNRVTTVTDFGIQFVNGGTGKYRDNLTASVPTAYSGGTDAGNNN